MGLFAIGGKGEGRGAIADEVCLLARARHMDGNGSLLVGVLTDGAQDLGVHGIDRTRSDAHAHEHVAVCGKSTPVLNVAIGSGHISLDVAFLWSGDLAIDHAVLAGSGDGAQGRTRLRHIGDSGNARREGLHGTQHRGIFPVLRREQAALLHNASLPGRIRHILKNTAHGGVLQVAVRIHEARDERCGAKVAHFVVRIPIAQLIKGAYGGNAAVLHHNGAVFDGTPHNGQDVSSG